MKTLLTLLLFFTLAIASNCRAQYNIPQNNKWAFGTGAGLDFTSGSPVAITTSMNSVEGHASVCDASGNFLFYTEGTMVWDRTGAVMPAGSAIVSYSTSSSTQGALIAPVIGNANQYYVFSLEDIGGGGGGGTYCRLEYCIVDMTLNSGLGDVVASSMGTVVNDQLAEKMIIIAGNNCDLWLVTHRLDSTKFLAYNITSAGLAAPVVSNTGTFAGTGSGSYGIGYIKASHDRQHIVCQVYTYATGTELYDFDPSTGIVSNCKVLDSTTLQYGAEFSPDNTKLYCANFGYQIDQYDITAGSAAAIRATRVAVVSSPAVAELKLGPDGKIYFAESYGSTFLSCIPNPNVAGSGCGYVATAVTLAGTSTATFGLPNVFVVPAFGGTVFKRIDSTLCLPAAGITINADTTGSSYLWSTGAVTSGITITTPGIYWVRTTNGCQLNIDTFNITNNLTDTVFHVHDTSFCSSAGSITINAQAGYSSYLWSTGALTPSISVSTTATVYAYSTLGCQVVIDTFHVVVDPFVQQALVSDTSYCFPGSLTLFAPAGYTANTWQDGSASTKLEVTTAGTYYVASTAYCKDRVDTFHVLPATLTFSLGPDVTVCINYMILPPVTGPDVTYKWQDGSTTSFYSAYHTGDYALTITKGGCVAYDTIRVNFFHFSQNIPDTFICKGVPISLELTATPPAGGQVLWNDGTTNPVKTVRDSGTYWVYVSKDECKILDTVHVVTGYCNCWHNVPTAFTPNNDGLNDVIKPAIEPGCTISGYQFNIFNRWGELVYTSDFQGKGWDGTYKGGPADMGVYNYSLQFFIGVHDKPVSQSGTITLVR